ncbi:MAG: PAS domain-containing protein, partial [Chthoniobacterales bacterium]
IGLIAPDGRWLQVNSALCQIFGFSESELRELDFPGLTHPEDRKHCQDFVRELLEGERPTLDLEKRYVHRDGRTIWTRTNATLLRHPDGEPRHLIAHIEDISDRKASEETLRLKEQNARRIADETPAMLWTTNATKEYEHFNRKYLEFTGFDLEECRGGGWMEAIHPDDRDKAVKTCMDHFEARTPFRHRHRLRRRDGVYRHIEDAGSPAFDENGVFRGFVGVYTDLTEALESENRATELAERLGIATEAARIGVWDHNVLTGDTYWDNLMAEIFGFELPSDSRVTFEMWRSVVHEDDVEDATQNADLAIRGEKAFDTTYRIHHSKLGIRHIRACGQVIRDSQGEAVRVIGVNWDVTPQHERETDIRAAMESAETANRAKSTFLATMSHEIRTPLNGIIGFTQLLLDSDPPAALKPLAYPILAGGESLLAIINDILDYSKIEAGHVDLERLDFSVEDILHETVELLGPKASEKDLTITMTISPTLPERVIGDPNRIRQIIVNLLSNAIKFTVEGEITIDARSRPIIGGRAAVSVSVIDTGIGIPADKRLSLFEPFNQLDASTNRRFGGTGLGLAISKRLVNAMDGELTVKSEPGEGTTFKLSLPLIISSADSDYAPMAKSVSQRIIPIHPVSRNALSLRLLVAEDNEINQRLLSNILSRMGFTSVSLVDNGQEAVDLVERQEVDAILMDCQMPVMDGYEATEVLRARGFSGPIIALTAAALSGDRERVLKSGMDDYLTKPLRPDLLAEAIERLVAD